MLGLGIGEIILIIIVSIIVLGPDKLPNALIWLVKTINALKKTLNDARDTLEKEVNLAELKREALEYKEKLEKSTDISKELKNVELIEEIKQDMNDIQHLFNEYKNVNLENKDSKIETNLAKDTVFIYENEEFKDSHKFIENKKDNCISDNIK